MRTWAIPLILLFLGVAAAAKPAPRFNEQAVYEILKSHVTTVDESFDLFHWEPAEGEFAEKFKPEDPKGLWEMTRASARSFLEDDGMHGFYAALDPITSRAYGGKNWRLIQMSVPTGLKYLDLREPQRSAKDDADPGEDLNSLMARLLTAMPGEAGAACARAMLMVINSDAKNSNDDVFGDGRCARLKRSVFKRLRVSGIRYDWQSTKLKRICPGKDRSAFVVTHSGWIKPELLKGYTKDTRGFGREREAIQEVLLKSNNGYVTRAIEHQPLWEDMPDGRKGPVSQETKRWMKERLVNCRSISMEPAPRLKWAGGEINEGSPDRGAEREGGNAPAN